MKKTIINDSEVEIDDDIYDLVDYMNNNGFETLNSCSGTLKDHPNENMNYYGYVMIKNNIKALNLINELYKKIIEFILQ